MKKITLLFVALLATTFMSAQITLSHSTDVATIEAGVACGVQGGPTAQNNWWRSYYLPDFPEVTMDFEIRSVEFGVGQVDLAPSASLIINIYTTDAPFPLGNLTLIGNNSTTVVTAADVGTLIVADLDTPAVVAPGDEVVVELIGLDDDTVAFRIGQNTLGETAPSYLSASDCSIDVPTLMADVGAGFDNDIILNLIGDNVVLGTSDNLAEATSIYPNPTSDVLNVRLPSNVELVSSSVFDVTGKDTGLKLVDGVVNTSNLARGVYILNVKTSVGTLTHKIVKQ